jgi:small-conductance mechanosensitive channel
VLAAEAWVGLVVLLVAVAAALALHAAMIAAIGRLFGRRRPHLASLLDRIKGPTALAFGILALVLAVSFVPLEPRFASIVAHLLLVGLIGLIGWMALRTGSFVTNLYLRRLSLEVGDNLLARKHVTQVRVLKRALDMLLIIVTIAAALMTFEPVRQYGVSLFASAGIAGLIVGFAARPVLSNLIAGVQLAVTQPIRIADSVVVEDEWGWVEEITSTYVVVRLWDLRRLIVPLTYFIEKPFQNWTRESGSIIGSAFIHADYSVPVDALREKLAEIVKQSRHWDGNVFSLQVTDAKEHTVELRALASAGNASAAWDLRCEVREKLIAFLRQEYPGALPRQRAEVAWRIDGAPGGAIQSSQAGQVSATQREIAESRRVPQA